MIRSIGNCLRVVGEFVGDLAGLRADPDHVLYAATALAFLLWLVVMVAIWVAAFG